MPGEIALTPEAIEATEIASQAVLSAAPGTLSLPSSNAEALGIEVESVVAFKPSVVLPYGALVRVLAVERQGQTTTLTTEQAAIEDYIEAADISVTVPLELLDGAQRLRRAETSLAPGVSIRPGATAREIVIEIEDIDLGQGVSVSGEVTIQGSVDVDLVKRRFTFEIEKFRVAPNVTSVSDVELTFERGVEIEQTLPVGSPIPIGLVLVGGLPVIPTIGLSVTASGEVTAAVSVSGTMTARGEADVVYQNGGWSSSGTGTADVMFGNLDIDGGVDAEFEAYLDATLGFFVAGIGGPAIFFQPGYRIERRLTPVLGPLRGFIFLKIGGEIRARFFRSIVTDYDIPLVVNIEREIFGIPQPPAATGRIAGRVLDAVSRAPLSGARVEVSTASGAVLASAPSGADGAYSVQVAEGRDLRVNISAMGYITATIPGVDVFVDETTVLETLLQIEASGSGNGTASGIVSNAVTGQPVGGLSVRLREGINSQTGPVVASTTTQSSGSYLFINRPGGYYTAEVSGGAFQTTHATVIVVGGRTTSGQNIAVSPVLTAGEYRIVLTWDASPRDLDSHLTGPAENGNRFHVFYANRSAGGASLDRDDTDSFGPETITIANQRSGRYRYSVHDFTNARSTSSAALSQSGARVQLIGPAGPVAVFNVPPQAPGTLWAVFELDGTTLSAVNEVSYLANPADVPFAPPPPKGLSRPLIGGW